jgi:hypothetical protein
MERLNYAPDELRGAMRYAREQSGHLASSHAGNWRRKFTQFVDAFTLNQECLKLLVRLFEGHQQVSGLKWYRAAADRKAPPLPADRYGRLALVWQLVARAMQKSNPDGFDSREKIDLPYVLVNSDLPGGSLGEKFEEFRQRFLEPFAIEIDAFATAVEDALPAGPGKEVDFWDAALAAFEAKSKPSSPSPSPTPAEDDDDGEEEAADEPKKKAAKKKGAKKKSK